MKQKRKASQKQMELDFVRLETAWLEAYTAWLQLNPIDKQMFPCPKRPRYLDGKVLINHVNPNCPGADICEPHGEIGPVKRKKTVSLE